MDGREERERSNQFDKDTSLLFLLFIITQTIDGKVEILSFLIYPKRSQD